jgi:hypothetical protein
MAVDNCHEQVVQALLKDGWHVEDSPVKLSLEARLAYVDVELSRGTNGSRQQIILVEVKCFPDQDSTTRDLYVSIGQYLVYRAMIVELGLPHTLYLSVPDNIFANVFDLSVMRVINESQIKIVVVNLDKERVTRWIN